MASMLTCLATSAGWCACTAVASLFSSCCGNDKPSSQAPGPTSGRRRSVLLLFLSIGLALVYQYAIPAWLVDNDLAQWVTFLQNRWIDGACDEFVVVGATAEEENTIGNTITDGLNDILETSGLVNGSNNENNGSGSPNENNALLKSCVGNAGNYRVSASTTLFFLLAGLASIFKPTANREAWPAKYILYIFLVIATAFISADPLFSSIYLNVARAGAALFIVYQQVVVLDLAHNWNDSWVEKSNVAESEEEGSGKKWLGAILVSCGILFAVALAMLIYMFVEFTGCPTNNTFIAMTLLFCILITGAQMSGDEGSLLASACVSSWAAFLCYAAVTKNPNEACNPQAGQGSPLSVAFGLTVTFISLLWTGWSYTAEDVLSKKNDDATPVATTASQESGDDDGKRAVTGVVTGNTSSSGGDAEEQATTTAAAAATTSAANNNDDEDPPEDASPNRFSNSWKLNLALATIACFKAMTLTHWGEIQDNNGDIANPSVGRISMWMIVASQWLVLSLYLWTLLAPRFFPDRDFS